MPIVRAYLWTRLPELPWGVEYFEQQHSTLHNPPRHQHNPCPFIITRPHFLSLNNSTDARCTFDSRASAQPNALLGGGGGGGRQSGGGRQPGEPGPTEAPLSPRERRLAPAVEGRALGGGGGGMKEMASVVERSSWRERP